MSGSTVTALLRGRFEDRRAADAAARWRFDRMVRRLDVVEAVLAEFATSYCGRPLRRRVVAPMESAVDLPGIAWSIDDEVMVEYLHPERGPGRVVVHELSLHSLIKKQLRSRHFVIERGGRA